MARFKLCDEHLIDQFDRWFGELSPRDVEHRMPNTWKQDLLDEFIDEAREAVEEPLTGVSMSEAFRALIADLDKRLEAQAEEDYDIDDLRRLRTLDQALGAIQNFFNRLANYERASNDAQVNGEQRPTLDERYRGDH